jgi:hypothetical protein
MRATAARPLPLMSENPTPAPAAPDYDLAALEQRQAALFKALANYQWDRSGDPYILPGAYGLALFHRFDELNSGKHSFIEAILVHEGGGEISSGMLPVEPLSPESINTAARVTESALLGPAAVIGSFVAGEPISQQTQTPPLHLQQEPAVESASPERRTGNPTDQDTPSPAATPQAQEPAVPAPDPAPVPTPPAATPAPVAAADPAPDAEEVEALLVALDGINNTKPAELKLLLSMFKDQFRVRGAFARAITTRERADWLAERIEGLKG